MDDTKRKNSNPSVSQTKNGALIRRVAKVLLVLNSAVGIFTLGLLIWELKQGEPFPFSLCGTVLVCLFNGYLVWRLLKGRPL